MDELMAIGRFARLTGLSVGALRHYNELGLLPPAVIDEVTGYRRYRRDQLEAALTIARLRELEVPLDEIRTVLAAPDANHRAAALGAHRARQEARTVRLQRVLHQINQVVEHKEALVSHPPGAPEIDLATRRDLAVGLFNLVWTLLETPHRTADQDDEMVHAAHASRYHWGEVGDVRNRAMSEWQCSRVYATLGRGEPAVVHSQRCLQLVETHGLDRWLYASVCEVLARAQAVAGDRAAAARWKARAQAALRDVADPDERQIVEGDIATLPL